MITISIFRAGRPHGGPFLDCPEIRRTPDEIEKVVRKFVLDNREGDASVRTYSEIPIQVVGEMIEEGFVSGSNIQVVHPDILDPVRYDNEGCLMPPWPYSTFGRPESPYGSIGYGRAFYDAIHGEDYPLPEGFIPTPPKNR